MRGKYTFKQDGRVVAESENLITTAGKRVIIDYIAGYTQRIAGAILLGIGNTAASLSDKSLNFEVSRVPVDLASADYSNNAVVFKGQVPAEQFFTVYETGIQTLYVTGQEFGSMMLLDFDSSSDDWSEGTFVTTNSRAGEALQLTSTASTSKTANLPGLFYDLSGYSDVDQFVLAYRANNAFVASAQVRFKTDSSNYYTWTIGSPASGAYTIAAVNKSSLTATGSPSWAEITSIDLVVTSTSGGTGSINFDALRIEDRDSVNDENVLVSRSVLGSPVTKVANIPLDVEYTITL